MRSNGTKRLLTRMLLVVSLLCGVMTFTGTTAEAQHRHDRVVIRPRVFVYPRPFFPRTFYPRSFWYNRMYYVPSNRVTEDQGYRDGLHDGKDDAKDNEAYSPQKHNDYKDAQSSAYLDGYRRGYDEGYRQVRG